MIAGLPPAKAEAHENQGQGGRLLDVQDGQQVTIGLVSRDRQLEVVAMQGPTRRPRQRFGMDGFSCGACRKSCRRRCGKEARSIKH